MAFGARREERLPDADADLYVGAAFFLYPAASWHSRGSGLCPWGLSDPPVILSSARGDEEYWAWWEAIRRRSIDPAKDITKSSPLASLVAHESPSHVEKRRAPLEDGERRAWLQADDILRQPRLEEVSSRAESVVAVLRNIGRRALAASTHWLLSSDSGYMLTVCVSPAAHFAINSHHSRSRVTVDGFVYCLLDL
ncbi:hypothetical protein MGYG_01600 [Nannizzia gypsea CBS 118893]|uniref:Uncharacterized protein n=1 Tax=Arthroderma gypseum (strain ATCC MYA-4604 / CBS 118893) TaxID=535722 RepID=E5R1U0_ARTGP|nr:hypothetical protein MGYG_01600 [Nannizzia gypsea CBS 118893]EFQ98574.1 hypothetical protein MGYG_01600 [Nannizzia gypsea CBS 118893]